MQNSPAKEDLLRCEDVAMPPEVVQTGKAAGQSAAVTCAVPASTLGRCSNVVQPPESPPGSMYLHETRNAVYLRLAPPSWHHSHGYVTGAQHAGDVRRAVHVRRVEVPGTVHVGPALVHLRSGTNRRGCVSDECTCVRVCVRALKRWGAPAVHPSTRPADRRRPVAPPRQTAARPPGPRPPPETRSE